MALIVYWTEFAENKLLRVKKYYMKKVSLNFALSMVDGIIDETIGLEKNPYIGQIEPTLTKKPQKYRYLIHKSFKIIYWINEKKNRIDIANVFDTRQDPTKIEQSE